MTSPSEPERERCTRCHRPTALSHGEFYAHPLGESPVCWAHSEDGDAEWDCAEHTITRLESSLELAEAENLKTVEALVRVANERDGARAELEKLKGNFLSEKERDVMEHATAWRHPRNPRYRNYYFADPSCDTWPTLQGLCARGLMRSIGGRGLTGGMTGFAVTDAGIAALPVVEQPSDSTLPDPSSGVLGEATPEEPDA